MTGHDAGTEKAVYTSHTRGAPTTTIHAGDGQRLCFRETSAPIPPYDGHHILIYIGDFSGRYRPLIDRKLITLETGARE